MSSDRTNLKNQQDGGEAILEAFRNLHVDYVISSPGSEWPPIWEALARQKIGGAAGPTYLDCGHETLAVGVAVGYAQVTGRMQAVLLHAGSGLLQGAMGIQGARAAEVPMVVMSGESLSYGELSGFDPGNQWYRNLGVVGGPQRLIDSVVKWANQAPSPETLYQSVIRAGEMAKRVPPGPVYLNVPVETMMHAWTPPKKFRDTPEPPKLQPLPDDVARVAALIAKAKCPIIITESTGRDSEDRRRAARIHRTHGHPGAGKPCRCLCQFSEVASHVPRHQHGAAAEGGRSRPADRESRALVSAKQLADQCHGDRNQREPAEAAHGLSDHGGRHLPRRRCRPVVAAADGGAATLRRNGRQA